METPIFLLVLGAVVLAVLFQIRRELRSENAPEQPVVVATPEPPMAIAPPAAAPAPALPVVVVERVEVLPVVVTPPLEPVAVVLPTSVPEIPVVDVEPPMVKKSKRRVEVGPRPSPATKALEMLKDRDALAAAFVLREIFDPPLSRRRRG